MCVCVLFFHPIITSKAHVSSDWYFSLLISSCINSILILYIFHASVRSPFTCRSTRRNQGNKDSDEQSVYRLQQELERGKYNFRT